MVRVWYYRGRPNVWSKILDPEPDPRVPPLHVHSCPECYGHAECYMPCDLEPDLEHLDGTPSGSHSKCEACEPTEPQPKVETTFVSPDQLTLPYL